MRKVEGHPDFGRLETRLVSLIRETRRAGPLSPVLVVVATTRLKLHVQRLLVDRFGSLLNVSVLHHARLAAEAAEAAGARLPRLLPPRVREEILERCLAGGPSGLSRYAQDCPGALAALRSTMDDLRDAGADAGECRALELTPRGREILELHGRYAAEIEALAPREMADGAGRAREATRHVPAYAKRFEAAIHYGAYELIGSNLDLMRAVESAGVPVTWLVPTHPTAPAFSFARRFAGDSLESDAAGLAGEISPGGAGDPPRGKSAPSPAGAREDPRGGVEPDAAGPSLDEDSRRLLGDRLAFLYDEEAGAPDPLPPGKVSFFHCQGARAELQETARRVLDLAGGEKIRLTEIAVIARDLSPYAPLLEPVLLREHGLPFVTTASRPAVADPHVLAALRLARLVQDGWERQPLLDLARTGLLRLDGGISADDAALWDLLSRRFAVSRDARIWREMGRGIEGHFAGILDGEAGEEDRRRAALRRTRWMAAAGKLERLIDAVEPEAAALREASSWSTWSESARVMLESHVEGFQEPVAGEDGIPPGARTVRKVLDETGLLDEAGLPFAAAQALSRFERALAEETIALGSRGGEEGVQDNGGLRVLDAEQARGLSFRHVFLIGFTAEMIPRRPREDPFLPDADRSRIRSALSLPVPVKAARREEEHLLLAHLLGAAREGLTLSWQRADDSGRARVPSLALREVSRIVLGEADAGLPLQPEHALRVAAHPADLARDSLRRFRRMPPEAARLGAALTAGSPGSLAARAGDLPDPARELLAGDLQPGLSLLEAVESFGAGELPYDGFVGEAAPPQEIWSPSQLERLGNCALHFFFRDVLGVEPVDDVLEEHQLERSELGLLAHAVLHETYQTLMDEGVLSGPGSDAGRAARRGVEIMERAWARRAGAVAARMHRRYPFLWRQLSELWKNSLRTFLLHDIADLERQGARVVGVEHEVRAAVELGLDGSSIAVTGRFDRLVRGGDGLPVVADYKTGGNLQNRIDPARILKGRSLQLPLYVLMEEAEARAQSRDDKGVSAQVIGIGPSFSEGSAAAEPQPEGYPAREILDAGRFDSLRGSLLETLRVLVETAGAGTFPLNPATTWCAWCPYARACRTGQAPTLSRLAASPAITRYLALDGKSTRRPFLDPPSGGTRGAS